MQFQPFATKIILKEHIMKSTRSQRRKAAKNRISSEFHTMTKKDKKLFKKQVVQSQSVGKLGESGSFGNFRPLVRVQPD